MKVEEMKKTLQTQERPKDLKAMIEASAKELARALPKHMGPERLVRIALTCIRTNPELAKCTPESFLGALFTSAQLGIEPIAGRAYLLPFNNNRKNFNGSWEIIKECQFVMGYKGLIELFYRHEKAVAIRWNERKRNDGWKIINGTESRLVHEEVDGNRGDTVGFWVVAELQNGGKPFHYMTLGDCIAHGKEHSKSFDKKTGMFRPNSLWATNLKSACLKTVLIQLCKILPLSIELQTAVEQDETARDFRSGIDNVLDIPSQVNWDESKQETDKKPVDVQPTESDPGDDENI